MRYFKGLIFSLLFSFSSALVAAPIFSNNFAPSQANQTLSQINDQLSKQTITTKDLESSISILSTLQNQAKQCIDEATVNLNTVNSQLKEIFPKGTTPALTSEQKFLQEKKNQLSARLSECRLFVIRSNEAIENYTLTSQQLAKRQLLESEPHFLAKITNGIAALQTFPSQLNKSLFIRLSGIKLFTLWSILVLALSILLAFMVALKLRKSLTAHIKDESVDVFTTQLIQAFFAVTRKYIVIILPLFILSLFFTILDLLISQLPYITAISYGLLAYFVALAFIHLIFNPPKPAQALSTFPKNVAKSFVTRLSLLALFLFFSFTIFILFKDQPLSPAITKLARTLFVTLLAINLISIVWLVNHMPKVLYQHPAIRSMLSFILGLALVIIIATEWLGYHGIANYLLLGITFTLLSAFVAWFVYRISMSALNSLSDHRYSWQQHLHVQLGLKKHQAIPELIWLRIVVYFLIWGGFVILLLKIWGLSKSNFRQLTDALFYGFHVAGIPIVLPQILLAFLLFTFLVLLTRWLRNRVHLHPGLDTAPGARTALAAIVGYVGFAIAALFALLVAGVNFAGLAIIAGALSVGIGFGLQNIVNNFVSGIILLVERPIKLGDRIIVAGTEGYVKKISIRSTLIETPQRSNVIVPNSEFITGQVINLMYHNLYSRIVIPISVVFGSDTDLVKRVLLEIGKSHPDVISDYPATEPTVVFKQIANGNLDFELSCLISDVNKQGLIKSDLYFAINKIFAKHDIKISSPQQDINIREWPSAP